MKKWKFRPESAFIWWESLSIDEKVDYKKRFEIYRNQKDMNYPNMYDLRHIRTSQLSEKHIVRIFVFKDKI